VIFNRYNNNPQANETNLIGCSDKKNNQMDTNSQQTILIIDDNPSNLKLLHELLSNYG